MVSLWVYKTLGIGKLIGAPVPGTMTAVWWETQIDPTFGVRYPASRRERYARQLSGKPTIATGCRGVQYSRGAALRRGHAIKRAVEVMLQTVKIAFLGLRNDFSTL